LKAGFISRSALVLFSLILPRLVFRSISPYSLWRLLTSLRAWRPNAYSLLYCRCDDV